MTDEEIVAQVSSKLTGEFYIGARVRLNAVARKHFKLIPPTGLRIVSKNLDRPDCYLVHIGEEGLPVSINTHWLELE